MPLFIPPRRKNMKINYIPRLKSFLFVNLTIVVKHHPRRTNRIYNMGEIMLKSKSEIGFRNWAIKSLFYALRDTKHMFLIFLFWLLCSIFLNSLCLVCPSVIDNIFQDFNYVLVIHNQIYPETYKFKKKRSSCISCFLVNTTTQIIKHILKTKTWHRWRYFPKNFISYFLTCFTNWILFVCFELCIKNNIFLRHFLRFILQLILHSIIFLRFILFDFFFCVFIFRLHFPFFFFYIVYAIIPLRFYCIWLCFFFSLLRCFLRFFSTGVFYESVYTMGIFWRPILKHNYKPSHWFRINLSYGGQGHCKRTFSYKLFFWFYKSCLSSCFHVL